MNHLAQGGESDIVQKGESDHLFSFPCFLSSYCQKLVEGVEHYLACTGDSAVALELSQLGLSDSLERIVRSEIEGLLARLYPQLTDTPFDLNTVVMAYGSRHRNLDWPIHYDDSMATLNVCLQA